MEEKGESKSPKTDTGEGAVNHRGEVEALRGWERSFLMRPEGGITLSMGKKGINRGR